ncbi:hypothetical protein TPHA_0G02360 [Tetrapisispora phaffii CBS 4417]|uniref:DNA repair protein RAD5 n=1 Tax=Tetrapisispora phaffii (strain ATCC 24235 / CBS 4417 / NBRC 1672 / NRRL Y-8282 / UCD 70-5) TaxID=1071381 RepID=G8BVZ3_TETPH|nr:hypothetical protein TPHA_0G02360 [Tetrapisispora phaffii CBS 4417]CCE64071.1 hypothetical protein TPHA_0G02360 [Tetrapisispora phaffii CBS 4417]
MSGDGGEDNIKRRFFKDELESSVDNSSTIDISFDKKDSILFGNSSNMMKVEEDQDNTQFTDEKFKEFQVILSGMLPDIENDLINDLYKRFKDHDNLYDAAVEFYFSKQEVLEHKVYEENIIQIEEEDEEENRQKNIDQYPSSISEIHNSSQEMPNVYPLRKRRKEYGFRESKQLKKSIDWKRFIGAYQVNAMITRPMLKPLQYGTGFKIVKDIGKQQRNKIYSSSGKNNLSMSSFVKIYDSQTNREVAKLPEHISDIIFPLLERDEFIFDLTLIYSEPRRLRIGDNIVLQLDVFLTSTLFSQGKDINISQNNITKQAFAFPNMKLSETITEIENREYQTAIVKIFSLLNVIEVIDENVSFLDSDDKNEDSAIIIDLEGNDGTTNTDIDNSNIVVRDNIESSQLSQGNELNINQINAFYKVVQSDNSILKIPETTPDKTKFKYSLRRYQKQGLTWMLKQEQEFSKLGYDIEREGQVDVVNPFWKKYKWPKDMSWENQKIGTEKDVTFEANYFYSNLYTGKFAIERPIMRSTLKGGILADEMGLGKTISALALILTVPYHKDMPLEIPDLSSQPNNKLNISSHVSQNLPYASKTTLVVVPMSLLTQWYEEFNSVNAKDELKCEIYYGGNVSSLKSLLIRNKNPPTVVLTTYGIVQNEWIKLSKVTSTSTPSGKNLGLFSVKFFRIILDEGHIIRNRSNVTSKAVLNLSGERKWVLTGTPIINRIDDLYNLINFLNIEPWSQVRFWKNFVTIPFEQKEFKKAFNIVNSIIEPISLRRTKQMKDTNGEPLVKLPAIEVLIEKLNMNEPQSDVYNYLLQGAEQSVRKGIQQGNLLKKYSTILVHILRLRQACCDIQLLNKSDDSDEDLRDVSPILEDANSLTKLIHKSSETSESLSINSSNKQTINEIITTKYLINNKFIEVECFICIQEPINVMNVVFTQCGHCFCEDCILSYIKYQIDKKSDLKCPICREEISKSSLYRFKIDDENILTVIPYITSSKSAKIEALIVHLGRLFEKSPGEQVVVFSQFSSYLDILEKELMQALPKNTTEIYKFDGKLSLKERSNVLQQFKIKSLEKQKILLLSLKAGGVGLNLTCCSHAFIMDPWWSPSMEDQAVDRIHRIGQKNPVTVIKFIISNTIEEKMLRIQDRKRSIGEAMDVTEDTRRQRRIEEIQMLFE